MSEKVKIYVIQNVYQVIKKKGGQIMLSFNCFYNVSSVLIYGSVYATILVDKDDQYCAVLNASTSDDGT